MILIGIGTITLETSEPSDDNIFSLELQKTG